MKYINMYFNKINKVTDLNKMIEWKAFFNKQFNIIKHDYNHYTILIQEQPNNLIAVKDYIKWLNKNIDDMQDFKFLINLCNKRIAELEGGE